MIRLSVWGVALFGVAIILVVISAFQYRIRKEEGYEAIVM